MALFPYETPKNNPDNVFADITNFNWPGPLQAFYTPKDLSAPNYLERYVIGSPDRGKHFATRTKTPFTIDPIYPSIDYCYDFVYLGGGNVVGYALTSDDIPDTFLRIYSTNNGASWSMKVQFYLPLLSPIIGYFQANLCASTYAGDGEVFTTRPDYENGTAETYDWGRIYKSTDYGDQIWYQIAIVHGLNVRGITYIGKGSDNKKRFLLVADTYPDFGADQPNGATAGTPTIFKSVDDGVNWNHTEHLAPSAVLGGEHASWEFSGRIAYLGNDEVICAISNLPADSGEQSTDITIHRSTDAGDTWEQIYRFPPSPNKPAGNAQVYDVNCRFLSYLGTETTEKGVVKKFIYCVIETWGSYTYYTEAYRSEDGGYTWEYMVTYPYTPVQGANGISWDWSPDEWMYVRDNGAIPGLY